MKGLILKDLYMMKKYCKSYILLTAIFIALSFTESDNLFLAFYPCILCTMIPVNLLSYDERCGWLSYSQTMPYTRTQIVNGKYLVGICVQTTVIVATAIAQAIKMNIDGTFVLTKYFALIFLLVILSLTSFSICLPFVFKMGVEKGRIFYAAIGLIASVLSIGLPVLLKNITQNLSADINLRYILPVTLLIGIGIYSLSWYLSIVFYKKREI